MEMHRARFDGELIGEVEADVGKLGGLLVVRNRLVGVPLPGGKRGGARRGARIVVVIIKRRTVRPQSRHVVGAAGVLVLSLLPVQASEPVEVSARFGNEPQLMRPALR